MQVLMLCDGGSRQERQGERVRGRIVGRMAFPQLCKQGVPFALLSFRRDRTPGPQVRLGRQRGSHTVNLPASWYMRRYSCRRGIAGYTKSISR